MHYTLITLIKRNRPNELGAKINPKHKGASNCKHKFIRQNAQLKAEHPTESKIPFIATEDTAHSAVFRPASPASRRIAHYRADDIRYCTTDDAHRSAVLPLKKLSVTCVPASVFYSHVDNSGVKGRPDATNMRIHTQQNICLLYHGFYTH